MGYSHHKRKTNVGTCYYHLCRKRTEVHKCKFCGEYFCKEHIKPKPSGLPRFNSTSHRDRLFMEEWHKIGGHPCIPYLKHWEAENQRREEEYKEALDSIKSEPTQSGNISTNEETTIPLNKPFKKKSYLKYIIGGLVIIFISYLFFNFSETDLFFGKILNCTDGTLYNYCSKDKPYYCFNGTLIKNSTTCGCPYDYRFKGDDCELIPRCNDRTVYGECSSNKPFFCLDGNLVKEASKCGCSGDDVPDGDICISKYMTNPKTKDFGYVLRSSHSQISYTVYGGMNGYLSSQSRSISYYEGQTPPNDLDFIMKTLNNEEQKPFINPLIEEIKSITSNKDDQARIAISLVQNIDYDYTGLSTKIINGKYPYEVLYTGSGVCSEKSQLLAYMLRELGYGVVIFIFDTENHDAIGIKCPQSYSYKNSGYCFVESTSPTIITDSSGDYLGVGKLTSTPDIIKISDGNSFDSVSEEYSDYLIWSDILMMGQTLDSYNYNKWRSLVNKYGMKIE